MKSIEKFTAFDFFNACAIGYKAWDNWYNDRTRLGGHPWEVCRGGNSTHVSLNVSDYSEDGKKGYYFIVAGKSFSRAAETINFYVAIKEAGYPIIISDGEAMLSRLKATDYIGIVLHKVPTRYCELLFDKKYGTILDFIHVYDEEIELYGNKIEWLPLVTS